MHEKPFTSEEQSKYEYDKAPQTMGLYLEKVDIKGKVVLDFGCGWGGETLWLRRQGAEKVIGIDTNEDSLSQARDFCSEECIFTSDITSIEDGSIDYIFSTNVFEHVMDIPGCLDELNRILKPAGEIISYFGPLFYSPYGCHFYWAKPFPYSHLIFGRKWLTRKINKMRGTNTVYGSWEDMGLNRITYQKFYKEVASRFSIKEMRPIAVMELPLVTKIPIINKFFTFGCEMHVCKSI
jgi:ubiquinone/menaquinone biosynthesis C-methylase UbiE